MFTGVITIAVWQLVQAAAVIVLGFAAYKLYAKWDDRLEKLREAAFDVAVELEKRGFKRLPKILRAFAVGNHSGVWDEIKSFARAIKDGPEAIGREFDGVFASSLRDKLSTKAGIMLVKAELALVEASTTPATV
jgi:hypothetical protein